MIIHIVMFKFKDEAKEANLRRAKQELEALFGAVPSLKKMEVGINVDSSERAMDLSLYSVFEDFEGLKEYATHPTHLKVRDFLVSVSEYSKVSDYEA